MSPRDRDLGMNRAITRRDFVQGAVGGLIGGAALGLGCSREGSTFPSPGPVGAPAGSPLDPATYPPARLGLRGSHPGSFEVAHQLALEHRSDWGPIAEPDAGEYDLVVVGAGLSGLAAAFFFLEQQPDARVLLLENHDDFGGHAKRNEFEIDGRTVLGYGGSQSLEAPSQYSDVAKRLLRELAVDVHRLEDAYDVDFYRRHDLAAGIYFNRATYGTDRVVRSDIFDPSAFVPVARAGVSDDDAVREMPFSDAAKQELLRLLHLSEDRLPDQSLFREAGFLETLSYRDFLTEHLGVREPEVIGLLQDVPSGYWGHGIDALPALYGLLYGLPGLGGTSLGRFRGLIRRAIDWSSEPYLYHFPDGNASLARLLVRRLIPDVAKGSTMEDVVTARFDYSKLDRPDAPVRLRLESTVVNVTQEGDKGPVSVTYIRGGRATRCSPATTWRSRSCVRSFRIPRSRRSARS